MKASEFIKKFGWDEAKEAIKNVAWCETAYCLMLKHGCFKSNSDCCVDIKDLKRLVESHEIVESYTSRFNSDAEWFYVSEYCKKNRISPFFSENYDKASNIYKKAIADVESCQ